MRKTPRKRPNKRPRPLRLLLKRLKSKRNKTTKMRIMRKRPSERLFENNKFIILS